MTHQPSSRVLAGGFAVGLLFATLFGIGSASSGGATAPDQPAAHASVETTFSPVMALVGLALGYPVGCTIGFLLGRRGLAGAVGAVLVALVGGFAGMTAAGLVGAETRVVVSRNSVSVDHGPPPAVLIGGGVAGLAAGLLVSWRLRPGRESAPRLGGPV